METEQLITHFQGVKPNGTGYTALCPAHDDHNPSLSITEGDDGRILLKDFGGCTTEAIVQALGLDMSDLFNGNGEPTVHSKPVFKQQSKPQPPSEPEPEPIDPAVIERMHQALTAEQRTVLKVERMLTDEIVDRYKIGFEERSGERRLILPVADEAGTYRDARRWLHPKYRKDDSAKILHWEKGYGKARLYPIDQLEADEVVLCEGELDALALISYGIAAVTITAGVSTWPDSLSEQFIGKQITVITDNDDAGEKGLQKRCASLHRHAAAVRAARWPEDRETSWDVTDELKAHGVESVKAILATAEPFESEELLPRATEKVEPFPTKALAGSLRRLVEEGALAIQCAPDLIGIPLLVAAGAAIGNSRSLRLKAGWEERAALYAAPIALPGQAKTPAMNLATKSVHQQAARLRQQYDIEKATYEAESREPDGPFPEKPKMKRVVISDATVEAVASTLQENDRGVLMARDELSGFAQALNAYKGGKGADRQFFLSTWSGTPASVDRKKQDEPLFLDRPFLAITGTIQPDCIQALLHEAQWDDGFLDRFLFAFPDYQPVREWTEEVVSDVTHESVETLFERLYGLEMEEDGPAIVTFNEEAKSLWIDWYNHTQREQREVPDTIRGVWSKMANQCSRLILICHLCRWAAGEAINADVVDQASVTQGTLLAEYFKSHARRVMQVLGESEEEKRLRKIINWLKRRGNKGVRPRDVLSAKVLGKEKVASKVAADLLDMLVERGEGEWRDALPGPSGQSKSEQFFLL